MTVTVDTPEGLKSGYSVIEVMVKSAPEIQGLSGTRAFVRGEAVTVDLGAHGKLFAVWSHDDAYRVVFDSFPGPPGLTRSGIEYYTRLKGTKSLLGSANPMMPLLVYFEDINDPMTVKKVDSNNLAKVFGDGVQLKEIAIEMTDEPTTTTIDKHLVWLKGLNGGYLGGGGTAKNTPLGLDAGYFKREL